MSGECHVTMTTAICEPEQTPPSQPSEGTNPANTLGLDFQPPEPGDDRFLLLKPPGV